MDMHRTESKSTPAEEPVFPQFGRLMTLLELPKKHAALGRWYSACSPVLLGSTSHFQILVTNGRLESSVRFHIRLVGKLRPRDFEYFNINITRQRLISN